MSAAYIYRVHDGDTDDLLYIGSSSNPRSRISAHRRRDWWPANPRVEIEKHQDRDAAYVAEREAIKRERPRHNIVDVPSDYSDYITAIVDAAPPLRREQLDQLRVLLEPIRHGADD